MKIEIYGYIQINDGQRIDLGTVTSLYTCALEVWEYINNFWGRMIELRRLDRNGYLSCSLRFETKNDNWRLADWHRFDPSGYLRDTLERFAKEDEL